MLGPPDLSRYHQFVLEMCGYHANILGAVSLKRKNATLTIPLHCGRVKSPNRPHKGRSGVCELTTSSAIRRQACPQVCGLPKIRRHPEELVLEESVIDPHVHPSNRNVERTNRCSSFSISLRFSLMLWICAIAALRACSGRRPVTALYRRACCRSI